MQNGQLLVSSGNSSMDAIFGWLQIARMNISELKHVFYTFPGGGLQLGSMMLIEEDKHGVYSKALHRYFLGEGSMHNHQLLVVNLDEDPKEFVSIIYF